MIKKNLNKNRVVSFLVIVIIAISGCTATQILPESTVSVPIETEVLLLPIRTPAQPMLIPTSTAVLMATRTAATSTLTSRQGTELIKKLLEDNGGCRLPCVLGITPGETDYRELQSLFNSFGNNDTSDGYVSSNQIPNGYSSSVSSYDDSTSALSIYYWDENTRIPVKFVYSRTENSTKIKSLSLSSYAFLQRQYQSTPDGQVIIEPQTFIQTFTAYTPSSILATYGEPDQVFIFPYPGTPESSESFKPYFTMILFYEHTGIHLEYVAPRVIIDDEFEFCSSKLYEFSLNTWSPDEKPRDETPWHIYKDSFRPLEEVTSLTIAQFTEIFQDPDACLRTPIEGNWSIIE